MINKRLFGSPIPEKVREKLEARQKVAGKVEANESIQSNFKTTDGGILTDLSSRTPFVRMWTAVGVVEKGTIIEDLKEFDPESEDGKVPVQKEARAHKKATDFAAKQPGSKVIKEDGKFYVKKDPNYQVDYSRKIYVVNNHTLNYEINKNPNESLKIFEDTDSTVAGDTSDEALTLATPGQQQSNEFLKPPAGITSVTSTTEGTLGVMKKTTINFEVHNFNDFDKIYNKFFLRPGAQIFVDFGWDTSTLYDPVDLIDSPNIKEFLYNQPDKDTNSTLEGIITQNQGDLEVLQGIVTSYDAKIKENGSIECSVELTSKNSALLSFETNQSDTRRIQNILDHAVLILGVGPTLNEQAETEGEDKISDLTQFSSVPDSNTSTEEIDTYTKNLTALAQIKIGNTKLTPTDNSIRTGVYISSLHANDIYISWGRFEDLIINSQFGFGKDLDDINDGNDLQIRMDSSNSFTSYSNLFVERQMALAGVPEDPPKFILPKWWGDADPKKDDGGNGSYSHQAKKTPEYPEGSTDNNAVTLIKTESDYDIDLNRIPIREIYINGDIIIKALKANDNVHKAIIEILKKINEDSDGVFDWKVISGETDSELVVIDSNRTEVQSLIKDSGVIEDADEASKKENEYFKNLFTFNIMSPFI